jgi:23S rRNA (cytidine1920-2'-O)/16S rRNA (cytidine1409-2'-O)-methyltransferase
VGSRAAHIRVDQLLVERGLADSRALAQSLILAGRVFTGSQRLDKPGRKLAADAPLEVKGPAHPWASRGGVKLDHALTHFGIDADGLVCLDLGASTGGFTDVLLSRGAARVYAVDVGHGQLAWRLQQDPRVVVLDRTNARHLTPDLVPEPVALITCDVSFIGLEKALPAALDMTAPGGRLVALVKPQFEVGKGEVEKGGRVRDPEKHFTVLSGIMNFCVETGLHVSGLTASPITGAKGNIEYLLLLEPSGGAEGNKPETEEVRRVVAGAMKDIRP